MIAMPSDRSCLTTSKRRSVSRSDKAVVGSSMTMMRGFEPRPRPVKHLLRFAHHSRGVCEESEAAFLGSEENVSRNREIGGDG